jgi:hypothetical protein
MNHLLSTEARGIEELVRRLRECGRKVSPSRSKTFDLEVDKVQAEVKVKTCAYAKLDFIGLTERQETAIRSGKPAILFLVCNAASKSPEEYEIIELSSQAFLEAEPKCERIYYYYGKALRALSGIPVQTRQLNETKK